MLDNPFFFKQLIQSPDRPFGVLIPQTFGDSIDDLNYAFSVSNYASPFPIST